MARGGPSVARGEGWTFTYQAKKSSLRLRLKEVSDDALHAIGKKWEPIIKNEIIPIMEGEFADMEGILERAKKKTGKAIEFRPWKEIFPNWKRAPGGYIIGHKPIGWIENGTAKEPAQKLMAKALKNSRASLLKAAGGALKP